MEICDNCGKTLVTGDECYMIQNRELVFCSPNCMKEYILENMADEVIEDWMEDHAECYEIGESDIYGYYGVSRSDF